MKKIVAFPFAAALALSATACSQDAATENTAVEPVEFNDAAAIDNFTATDGLDTGNAIDLGNDTDIGNASDAPLPLDNAEAPANAL